MMILKMDIRMVSVTSQLVGHVTVLTITPGFQDGADFDDGGGDW